MSARRPHAVIVGAGVSGLAAAFRLEASHVPYTLIEIKSGLGGSLQTIEREGFAADSGRMVTFDDPADDVWAMLALEAELQPSGSAGIECGSIFRHGQRAVVNALAGPLKGEVLCRMAVTSTGEFDAAARRRGFPRFCVCLENGTVLDADALVLAVPARIAERILRSLRPASAARLEGYRYDSIARLSLGYRTADILGKLPDMPPVDYPITYIESTDAPERVPAGCTLIQLGVRYDPHKGVAPESNGDLAGQVTALFDLPSDPPFEHLSVWPDDEPLEWLQDGFPARVEALHRALPEGVAIAGSDYVVTDRRPTLADRIRSGFAAAERVSQVVR